MVELWYGAEPYLIRIELRTVMAAVEMPEMNITADAVLDEAGYQSCYEGAFLTDKRLVVFRVDNLKSPYVKKLLDNPTDNRVIIIASSVDKRLAVFKAFSKDCVREFKALDGDKFDAFLKSRIKHFAVPIRNIEEYNYLKDRLQYGARPNCNLFTVENYLKTLAGIGSVDKAAVDEVIPKHISENNFGLFPHLIEGEKQEYYELLDKVLATDDGIGTLSSLLYGFRISYKVKLVGKENAMREIGLSSYQMQGVADRDIETLKAAMSLCQDGVNRIKRGDKGRDVLVLTSAELFNLLERAC